MPRKTTGKGTPPARAPEIPCRSSNQLGAALARFRRLKGLTQVELSRSSGIRQATLSQIENGTTTPSANTVFAICAALGLELVVRSRGSNRTGE